MSDLPIILLAAGASSRFGADKLLHRLADGVPLALAALANLKKAELQVVAVVRPESESLAQLFHAAGAQVVCCENASDGMSLSLGCGVRAAGDARGWLIALADMPRIRPETIREVARRIEQGALIAAPCYCRARGHPVGFSAQLREELLNLRGDEGARSVLARHADAVELIDCDDPGILLDIDLPADLPEL
jgi:molybdenum cofactor cytidylyltransferase